MLCGQGVAPARVAQAAAPRFADRMGQVRFYILTPDVCVHWDGTALSTTAGVTRAQAPAEDALEDHWRTYYAAIFNPAGLMVGNPFLVSAQNQTATVFSRPGAVTEADGLVWPAGDDANRDAGAHTARAPGSVTGDVWVGK